MDDELPTAISGTRRALKELVDGTIRVQIDIDPRFKADFHRLFPNIDTPVALAPFVHNFEDMEEETRFAKWDQETRLYPDKPKEKPKNDKPLCKLAGMWPKDSLFLEWLSSKHQGEKFTEEEAAQWIRDICDVESRSQIDGDLKAEEDFHNRIRIPYSNWIKGIK